MKIITRSTATGLLALGLSVGVAAPTFAVDDPPPVPPAPSEGIPSTSRSRCVGAINRRVVHLATWSARISLRQNLTEAQKSELIGEMTVVSNGLLTVALPAVQNAATRTELRAACRAVFTDYRVYLVVQPRTFITANAWGWLKRIDELQAKALELQTAGKDTTVIDGLLAHAEGLALPIHDQLDGIDHTVYNNDPVGTRTTFNTARGTLKTVQDDVKQAAKLIRKLKQQN
jgi:hypothetical protein